MLPTTARCLRLLASVLCVVVATLAAASTPVLVGRVHLDRDANGRIEPGEPPLPGVRLSDGERVVASDASGAFRFERPTGPVFVVKPPHHRLPMRPDGLPDFWRPAGTAQWDIALAESPLQAPYDVRVFGDPQPKNTADVGYYERDIVADEARLPRARLGVSLGDIVHGNLALLPAMARATAATRTPGCTPVATTTAITTRSPTRRRSTASGRCSVPTPSRGRSRAWQWWCSTT